MPLLQGSFAASLQSQVSVAVRFIESVSMITPYNHTYHIFAAHIFTRHSAFEEPSFSLLLSQLL